MILRRMLCLGLLIWSGAAGAQESGNVARVLIWQLKPGMTRDFEEGYKRHLDWHRRHNDTWAWHGWMIASGERDGYFMDASFQHRWTDFDSPVVPSAEDSADNDLNVATYADVRSAATYEAIAGDPNHELLTSRLLTVYHFSIGPGGASELESLMGDELRGPGVGQHALLLPVNGATEYLLLLPAAGRPTTLSRRKSFAACSSRFAANPGAIH